MKTTTSDLLVDRNVGNIREDPDPTPTLAMKERTDVGRPNPAPWSCIEADLEVSTVFSGTFPLAPLAKFSSDWFVVKGVGVPDGCGLLYECRQLNL
ncbi:hypothetical protein STEG23_029279, partial [Scotinomys teguina]